MKTLDEQDHYEILELPRDASNEEIERAYRIARGTYAGDSLATYSIFDAADAHSISERIELAYEVLADREAREQYDRLVGVDSDAAPPRFDTGADRPSEAAPARPLETVQQPFDDLDEELEDEGGTFDGARLRRARMRRGVEIQEIADVTKVNVNYLRCLEEESFDELPAEVYVRGFVTAYARAIGLDPKRVIPDFMARYGKTRGARRSSFLLGGP